MAPGWPALSAATAAPLESPTGSKGATMTTNTKSPLKQHTTSTLHPAITAMIGECLDRNLPKHYRGDITIDIATLSQALHDKPFIWILRECGTHLYFQHVSNLHTMFDYETRYFYVWDGAQLIRNLNSHQAIRRLSNSILTRGKKVTNG